MSRTEEQRITRDILHIIAECHDEDVPLYCDGNGRIRIPAHTSAGLKARLLEYEQELLRTVIFCVCSVPGTTGQKRQGVGTA